jgi:hypothetical protein
LFATISWADEKPRVGLEMEFSRTGPVAREMRPLKTDDFLALQAKALGFFQNIFKGVKTRDSNNYVYLKDEDNQSWWLEKEWVNGSQSEQDGIEIVTHPLKPIKIETFLDHYDEMLKNLQIVAGQRSALQFNLEMRSLIDGLKSVESTNDNLGVNYSQIKNLNIDKVVNLFLFCETNFAEIYGALAPKRMGRGINFYSVPYILDHEEILLDLAALPTQLRTVENVRGIFVKHDAKERSMKEIENGERAPYKFRAFNLDKFFQLRAGVKDPEWVYPAFEFRPIDTANNKTEFKANLDFVYRILALPLV